MTDALYHSLSSKKPLHILLVEDNTSDALLLKRAFADNAIDVHFTVADSGELAIEMLRKQGEHNVLETPDLILLDLKLSGIDGHDVLATIKNSLSLKSIPVIILSGSSTPQDVKRSYDLYANACVVKPASLSDYQNLATQMHGFWLQYMLLPDHSISQMFSPSHAF